MIKLQETAGALADMAGDMGVTSEKIGNFIDKIF